MEKIDIEEISRLRNTININMNFLNIDEKFSPYGGIN